MKRMMERRLCRTAIACVLVCAMPATSQTTKPVTGLGQAWPDAANVSTNPHWRVYVFMLYGIKYIQINDQNGVIHAAVGTAGSTSIVLPVGIDAQQVTTATTGAITLASETVYQDATTTIIATRQRNGTTQFSIVNTCKDPYNCGGSG